MDPLVTGRIGVSQSWNRYSYTWNNPLNLTDPGGKDVSIAIQFEGDDWTQDMKAAVIENVKVFWETQVDVGDVFVFDAAKMKHGSTQIFGKGNTSIPVYSWLKGNSYSDRVAAGNYLLNNSLTDAQKAQATANAINHEVFTHILRLGGIDVGDLVAFARQPNVEPGIRERYGTIVDAHAAFEEREAFISGPLPVHPEDQQRAASWLWGVKHQDLDPPRAR